MRKLVLFLALAFRASAQTYTPPPEDSYLGLSAVPCTNTNTAFSIVKLSNNLVFCTPSGHAFFARGPFGFDLNLVTTPDESGNSYASYALARYGSTANWVNGELAVMKSLGMNMLPTYANANAKPTVATTKVPFIMFELPSAYSLVNRAGWNGGVNSGKYAKEMVKLLSPTWGGYRAGTGIADYRDPNWASMIDGVLTNDGSTQALAAASTAIKGDLLGFSMDDSDGTHGFGATAATDNASGAGTGFATQPPGNNDYRVGYFAMFLAPTNWANNSQGAIYQDGTVYWKKRMMDMLIAKYTTIGALNTAWGSAYTTFGTSGTVFGSLHPGFLGSPSAAAALGTGDGVTTTFNVTLNTTVTKFSVYVANGSTIVGGDTGAGALSGVTGTINYATGALSVTFATAPSNGAVLTAGYITNGWQIGTGFLDEDVRAGHSAYLGTGSQNTTTELTGIPANVKTDIGLYTQDTAAYYSSTIKAHIETWRAGHGFTGKILYFGPTVLGTWATLPDPYVLRGMCPNVDAIMYGGVGTINQAQLDYFHTNCGDNVGLIEAEYRTSNAQSSLAWPNSTATHSGNTVTVTVATPSSFPSLAGNAHIDATCAPSSWNATNVNFSASGSTVTYTAGTTPVGTTAVCNIFFDDANVGGFPSQAARGADFQAKVSILPTRAYTATGVRPFLGYFWWAWFDFRNEQENWGLESQRANLYNGLDDVNPSKVCAIGTGTCGGELALHGPPLGDVVTAVKATNTAIDGAILALSAAPTTTSTALGSSLNPATAGQAVVFTATVTASSGTPTGTVQFLDGATVLGTPAMTSGVATGSISSLTVGTHSITAVYSGDSTFSSSSSAPLIETITAVVVPPTPAQTLVKDTLKNADGTLFNGNFQISLIQNTTGSVQPGMRSFAVQNGVVSIFLTPALYRVVEIGAGRTTITGWLVPASATSVLIKDITTTTGTCTGSLFINDESPMGAIDGVNAVFTLSFAPAPPASLTLFRNGLRLMGGGYDYTLSGSTITFTAGLQPAQGDTLTVDYQLGCAVRG